MKRQLDPVSHLESTVTGTLLIENAKNQLLYFFLTRYCLFAIVLICFVCFVQPHRRALETWLFRIIVHLSFVLFWAVTRGTLSYMMWNSCPVMKGFCRPWRRCTVILDLLYCFCFYLIGLKFLSFWTIDTVSTFLMISVLFCTVWLLGQDELL
jgi:hypothetical protein